MRWIRVARHRLRSIFRRAAADEELDRELDLHVEQLVREHVASGVSPADARRLARRAFGSRDAVREKCRDARRLGVVEDLGRDVRYGLRMLARTPGFTATAVVSLALGIGANTAIYSLVDAVLVRMLPVSRPAELVFLEVAGSAHRGGAPPYPCFERIRAQTPALAGVAAFATDHLRVEVGGEIEQVFGQVASGNFFELLGVRPAAGRLMTMADERLDPGVAVIGYDYWQRRFGGDPGAIGRSIVFKERAFTIVGVTPPGFHGLQPGRQVEVTLPITLEPAMMADAGAWWFEAIARVGRDAGMAQAAAQADAVFQSFMLETGRSSAEARKTTFERLVLTPAARGAGGLRERFSTPLYLMTAIGLLVLLIACANLGGLLLARGETRSREMAIRMATGAGTGRLARQLLTETLLLFVFGIAGGLLVAHLALRRLAEFFAVGRLPIVLDIQYDWRLAAAATGVALLAGVVTGLWPVVRAVSVEPHVAMKDGDGRLTGSRRMAVSARLLVGGQMALSLVLVVAALFFVQTMAHLRAIDLGFRPARILTMSLDLVMPPGAAAAAHMPVHREVLARVRELPGVEAAGLSVLTPLSGRDTGRGIHVAGFTPRSDADRLVHLNHVSEDFFRTFGIPLLAGRTFTVRDAGTALPVAILSQSAARTYFAGRSPLGETIRLGDTAAYRVIGIVGDHKHLSIREPEARFVYVPVWQPVYGLGRVTLSMASGLPPAELARDVAATVRGVHSRALISDVIDVERQIDATLLSERLLSRLAGGFAALALVLASVGLYGILSYAVARRRGELGIRMALGAAPRQAAGELVRELVAPIMLGMAVGLPLAWLVARLAERLLFGVTPRDPFVYGASIALMALIATGASWVPACRAASIEPAEAIRSR